MRRRVITGGLILLALPVFLLPVIVNRAGAPAADPSSAFPARPFDPYDSIRTDLSDYAWPTDASRALTSTFGEYRSTHFHAGIDISTNDRNGYRVFASRDGYVSRIMVNADGYGKMLYVRHRDGYTTTYAHLQRFAPPLESRMRREQRARESYPVRIECAPHEFPVAKGELIAYTGDTGTGTSHFHFELRDENMNAVNPLQCPDFAVADTIPPVIRKVALVPLGPESEAGGSEEAHLLQPAGGASSGNLPATAARGTVGLAVQARDRGNGSRYSHGIYQYVLLLNGRRAFSYRIDRIPFHESQQIALHYNQELLRSRRGRFEKLYIDTPHSIPFLQHLSPGSGFLDDASLGEGDHRYTIIASDNSGNSTHVDGILALRFPPRFSAALRADTLITYPEHPRSIARIRLEGYETPEGRPRELSGIHLADTSGGAIRLRLPKNPPGILSLRLESHAGALSDPRFFRTGPPAVHGGLPTLTYTVRHNRVDVRLRLPDVPDAPPRLTVTEGPLQRDVPLRPMAPLLYAGSFAPLEPVAGTRELVATAPYNGRESRAERGIELFPLAPGQSGRYRFDEGRIEILFDTLSVYSTLLLTVDRSSEGDHPVYTLGPSHGVLRGGITVRLRSDGSGSRPSEDSERIYFSRGGSWRLLGGQGMAPDGVRWARITRFLGDVALLPDTEPPSVSMLRIRNSRRLTITFRYGDNRSGVDSQALKTYIDGKFVIPEIDGEHRRVVIDSTGPLSRGSHRLTIHLKDQLGNARVTERSFSVR